MTPEEQRIAIAEACGWKDVQISTINPNQVSGWLPPNGDKHNRKFVPDYLNDLNACHEMEKRLSEHDFWAYCDHLEFLTNSNIGEVVRRFEFVHATAAQRCEAFLQTLGLWKESSK